MADIFGASICKATHVLHDSSIINTILIHKGNNVHLGPARLIIKCSHCILIIYYYMTKWEDGFDATATITKSNVLLVSGI